MARRLSLLVLALAALAVGLAPAAAGGACHPGDGAGMTTSSDGKVVIDECAFADTVTYVDPGGSVTWRSRDVYPHTVTGAVYAWGDESMLERGDEVTYTFEDEGVYPYFCALHPSMVGAVVVGDGIADGGAGAGGIEKVDLAAAAVPDAPPGGGDAGGFDAASGVSVVVALAGVALVVRLASRRRTGADRIA
jgi:plastocyanin